MALSSRNIALIGGGTTAIVGGTLGTYYLSQDKTIRDKLIRERYALIENDKEYQIAFKEFKDNTELTEAITTTEKTINNKSAISDGAIALKNWCENNLKTNLSDKNSEDLINKSKKYCTKPPLTILEKIRKNNRSVIKEWSAKFEKIKQPDTENKLLNDLKTEDNQLKNFTEQEQIAKAIKALENWCTKQQKFELVKDTDNSVWKKVEARCLEDKQTP